ncbi:MAG: polyprenyl synthetase family protein [Atopobiaceae bacterium]|nr:polyprenyl synthetase family protein [Atopobiaceae bacterium]
MADSAFVAYLKEKRSLVDEALERQAFRDREACTASAPGPSMDATKGIGASRSPDAIFRYLHQPLERFVASGGKRTRPLICLLGCEIMGGAAEDALGCAIAIENFQSAALIHDDIADNGELRRGEPCVHVVEGEGIAINAGDLALVRVFSSVLEDPALSADLKIALLEELERMMKRTLEGQALDLGYARDGRWDISPADYLEVAALKTAHYSCATPLVCGAMIAHADPATIDALRSFGMRSGLAFQIQDDLLNIVGDAAAQGKDFRSDITEGKRTLMVTEALERLAAAGTSDADGLRNELIGILSSQETDPERLERAVGIMSSCGAIDAARGKAESLIASAIEALDVIPLSDEARELLVSMADFFVRRAG